MNRRILCKFLLAGVAIGAWQLAAAAPAFAAPADESTAQLITVIDNITDWFARMAGVVGTFFLTRSGLRRMGAGGDSSELDKAREEFRNALIGYALAVLAPVVMAVAAGLVGG